MTQLSKNELKDLVKRSDDYAIGALITISSTDHDDFSFQSMNDSNIINDVASFYMKKGYLSQNQIKMIRPKLLKYIGEIHKRGVDPVKNDKRWRLPKRQKTKDAEKFDEDTIKVKFPYDKETIKEIKKINNRKFNEEDKSWTFPLTIINLDKIIELGFNLSKELQEFYKERNKDIVEIEVPGLKGILKPFQKKAISFIENKNGHALIADDQGLGKTLESIAWIQLKGKKVFPVIIVCPASVKYNWKSEFEKFTDFGDEVEIINGTTTYDPKGNILIINYDILKKWKTKIRSKIKPKTIIGDEIHKIKNPKSKRAIAFESICKYAKNVIGLTGTPILNKPKEIYNPIKIIKPSLFPNEKQFLFKYCGAKNNGFGKTFNGATNTIELNQILTKEIMLRRKKEDVLKELADKTRIVMPLEIDNRSDYEWAYNDLIGFLKEIDEEKATKAKKAETLVKINTLKQLAIKGKMSQAISWIEDFIENDKLVVFTHHRETANIIYDKFQSRAIKIVGGMSGKKKEQEKEKFWNNDEIMLCVGNTESAGTGMNLQISSNVGFLEYPWSPGLFRQCEDRCHRIGQENAVSIWNLIAQNTIEASIVHILDEKAQVISEIIDGNETDGGGIFNDLIKDIYNKI